ncbi:hypothetical protein GTA08_BOTSDO12898 [Botryosphaeria dothidea]|uniref:Uncharacterized protein n=1 Tax=Botryosphaeria dothidea TaxID=55169 RepID=A0A8H4NA39_9PEZI|nr:hypothetical protein GTA08_BOTSDO14266 [Botryosphaeria dothidea]KAF4311426.1 hypothetical protein GTA08_BOTSDO12898 [Botryosphaeria dothidea]
MTSGGRIPAAIALVLFIIATGTSSFQAFRHKSWMFWSLILSGLLFIVAFAIRLSNSSDDEYRDWALMNVAIIPHSLAAFFLQQAVFMLFLRLVWWTAPSPSTLNRRTLWFSPRVGFYFMSGTLFLLAVVQAVPIPIFVFCGLIAQMILLAVFLAFVGRVWTVSKGWAGLVQGERLPGAWRRKGLVGVWAMSGLLMLRTILCWIFVLLGGAESFLNVYLFDTLPLLVCFILIACLHPGTYMPVDYTRLRMDRDSVMQTKMADSRVAELTRDAYLAANSSGTTAGRTESV